jgi:hypothetical protein
MRSRGQEWRRSLVKQSQKNSNYVLVERQLEASPEASETFRPDSVSYHTTLDQQDAVHNTITWKDSWQIGSQESRFGLHPVSGPTLAIRKVT